MSSLKLITLVFLVTAMFEHGNALKDMIPCSVLTSFSPIMYYDEDHPGDCRRYVKCHLGKISHAVCEEGSVADFAQGECVPAEDATTLICTKYEEDKDLAVKQ